MAKALALTEQEKQNISTLSEAKGKTIATAFIKMLDSAGTATNRATFYNTKAEQNKAVQSIHAALFKADRGIYELSLLLDGATDYNAQVGLLNLLEKADSFESILDLGFEPALINYLMQSLPPQRMLKLMVALRENKINNKRAKNAILDNVLGARNVELWSVKYRRKLRQVLTHAWGVRGSSIICSILSKRNRNASEKVILANEVDRFCGDNDKKLVYDLIPFIFSNDKTQSISELVQSYIDAKTDLKKGNRLPPEVLEGIRSIYHKDAKAAQVLTLTKGNMTEAKKMLVQAQAERAGVVVDFKAEAQDPVKMYIYAFERGMTDEIEAALESKARKAAMLYPVSMDHIGILVDCSLSMRGNEKQQFRPIATALAMRDMLEKTAPVATVEYVGGAQIGGSSLVVPENSTSLAQGLLKLARTGPEAIFVISDGYENAPAGRFAEVVTGLRKIGFTSPINQITPVLASEAGGVRALSKDVPVTPANDPSALGFGMIKNLFIEDPKKGIMMLVNLTKPSLDKKKIKTNKKNVIA